MPAFFQDGDDLSGSDSCDLRLVALGALVGGFWRGSLVGRLIFLIRLCDTICTTITRLAVAITGLIFFVDCYNGFSRFSSRLIPCPHFFKMEAVFLGRILSMGGW